MTTFTHSHGQFGDIPPHNNGLVLETLAVEMLVFVIVESPNVSQTPIVTATQQWPAWGYVDASFLPLVHYVVPGIDDLNQSSLGGSGARGMNTEKVYPYRQHVSVSQTQTQPQPYTPVMTASQQWPAWGQADILPFSRHVNPNVNYQPVLQSSAQMWPVYPGTGQLRHVGYTHNPNAPILSGAQGWPGWGRGGTPVTLRHDYPRVNHQPIDPQLTVNNA